MVSTSSEGILTEYLVKYRAICASERDRPSELLETLYIADCSHAVATRRGKHFFAITADIIDHIGFRQLPAIVSNMNKQLLGTEPDHCSHDGNQQ